MGCTDADAQGLIGFVDASPSPRHAAQAIVEALVAAGFQELSLRAPRWQLGVGGFFVARGATVIAWRLRGLAVTRFAAVGAHTDSPNLRLKPRAPYVNEGCLQFGVEVYGGALWNSWLDRDLGLAGAVQTDDGRSHLVRVQKPLARVTQLAIHLDRTVNEQGLKLNPQLHLAPLWGVARKETDAAAEFHELIARAAGVEAGRLVGHDLSLFDLTPSTLGGLGDTLVFAPRLDNLASCHAGLAALLDPTVADGPADSVPMVACFDHEEIGSASADGADGVLLGTVIERVVATLGGSREAYHAAVASSLMLSADMSHAVHPNYADKHEPRHKPFFGQGPVLKSNVNMRYATTPETAGVLRALARRNGLPLQDFVTRTDLGCGSTIGPITASRLGMPVVDLGAPMLSMHSARECMAAADQASYCALLRAHLLA
ncbi:MAG: M18 family aminopeptidase [Myxococcales bacterium]|nr:M18 family aminopeptidase [Myxococcales bacterium]